MPDRFDPTMMLSDAKNVGSATGGVTSSSPGKDKASYAQAFDGTANTGTTTTVKPGSGPTASPGANASKVPAGVAKFNGDRV